MKHAAMNYTLCGRKRKTTAWAAPKAKTMHDFSWSTPRDNSSYRRETTEYPSAVMSAHQTSPDDSSYKIEESKKFTIAPAYNKGAYQVIPRKDIQHIGK